MILNLGGTEIDDTPNSNSTERIAELLDTGDPDLLMLWFAFNKAQLTAFPSCGVGTTVRVAVPLNDDKSRVVYGFMTLGRIEEGKLCAVHTPRRTTFHPSIYHLPTAQAS